ncbi:2-C-methyl-D-erythritol 4-phosphate cytidylyltransferase [Paradesertivirga mongoliensis]|uniref:2-C-methyl-D-erythritol 4-phosphate cytidylyltransferase n=1 Tax=Paradesertivirga mongoliensis TaxID=2100740 RepID=A0ABW4ZR63_9SPHI|nr:2-C-methyl-D-erythritol 4-phosphate cytidylyltransferase [Pedobacter mongoliensis]
MKYYAIIVAGGSGSRMNATLPKQFLLLNGKPVLMHTIEAFHYSDLKPEIILVLNQDYHSLWSELCLNHHFDIPCAIVSNGVERFHSVKNGLSLVDEGSIVAVHDAVRPVISNELITKVFNLAERSGTAIPVVTSKDSVRKREGDATVSLNRQDVLLVQTPQAFKYSLLKTAYDQQFTRDFTDDACVVEKAGVEISVTEGSYKNIKITFPEDLELAELYLRKKE